ncbi:leucine-rich repeat domain-containing protein, partial [Verrucomicrobiota bacterium]
FATGAEQAGAWRQLVLFVKRNKGVSLATAVAVAVLALVVGGAWRLNVAKEHEALQARAERAEQAQAANAAKLALLEEEKKRVEAWLPVCDFDFSKETKLDSRFEAVLCPGGLLLTDKRQLSPVPELAEIEDSCLKLRRGEGLMQLHWQEDVGDDIQLECNVSGRQSMGLSVAGDSFRGYRIIYDARQNTVELDTIRDFNYTTLAANRQALKPAGERRRFRVEKSGANIRVWVDGDLVVDYFDPLVLSGPGQRTFSLSTFHMKADVYRLRVLRRRSPEVVSCLETGRELIRRRRLDDAEDFLRVQVQTHGKSVLGTEAQLLLGICLQHQKQTEPALATLQRVAESALDGVAHLRATAFQQIAGIHLAGGRFRDAADAAKEACLVDPGSFAVEQVHQALINHLRKLAEQADPNSPQQGSLTAAEQAKVVGALGRLPLSRLNLLGMRITNISPLKGMPLTELNCGDNQITNISSLKGMPLTELNCGDNQITNISSLKGMPLTELNCGGNRIADLSPLKGMPLTTLDCHGNQITDLSPLKGMPLRALDCQDNQITNISLLKGMPLTELNCGGNQITDLTPLKGMPLTRLDYSGTQITDLTPLKGMPLTELNCGNTRITDLSVFKGMPLTELGCWHNQITDLTPLKGMPLTELNCGENQIADLTPLKGMPITELRCSDNQIRDLSPLQGMPLRTLYCWNNQLADLTPLKGVPITRLLCMDNQITDLTPLKGMPITWLHCGDNQITDLSPLKDMAITRLACLRNQITDLSPLKGMPLTELHCGGNQITDLTPLKGMPLTELQCGDNQITDLTPLKGMALASFGCMNTQVTDLSPLKGMPLKRLVVTGTEHQGATADVIAGLPLEHVFFDPELAADSLLEAFRAVKGLKSLNGYAPAWFFQLWPDLRTALAGKPVNLQEHATPWRDRLYLCVPLVLPTDRATDLCRRQGGHLVCPSSAEEVKAVNALALKRLAPPGWYSMLTGGYWDKATQSYRWATGESWDAAWWKSLPVSRRDVEPRGKVLLFQAANGGSFFWASAGRYTFIIEWPADQ